MSLSARRHAGFTIIEMLVVLAVIAILIGLLLPAINAIRIRGQVKATKTLISSISAALERYYTEFDEYPPSNDSGLGETGAAVATDSLYRYLCGPDGKGLTKYVEGNAVKHVAPFMEPPVEYLSKQGTSVILVDSWRQPIRYLNCKAVTDATPADESKCYNPRKFDIYSGGPNRKVELTYPKPATLPTDEIDDVYNW